MKKPFVYGSVCSGIEAATVGWHPLGWKAAWYSEIEPFPSAVLAHHYPDTPNLGDMTKLHEKETFERTPIDLLVGGTPCQSFSVAGLRKGLADPRGNLALVFLGLLDRKRPRWVVWENVPGVVSSWTDATDGQVHADDAGGDRDLFGGPVGRDGRGGRGDRDGAEVVDETNDFDTFLGGLRELGYGVAWRVLDAVHFGVPQRRRRVFVVGYLGDWRPAAAVLFEPHGLSGHPAPSRAAGEGTAAAIGEGAIEGGGTSHWDGGPHPCLNQSAKSSGGIGASNQEIFSQGGGGLVPHKPTGVRQVAFGEYKDDDTAATVKARDFKDATDLVVPPEKKGPIPILEAGARTGKSSADPRAGMGVGDPGDAMFTLQAGKQHAVLPPEKPVVFDARGNGDGENVTTLTGDHASRPTDYTPLVFEPRFARNGRGAPEEVCPPLKAQSGETGKGDAAPVVVTKETKPLVVRKSKRAASDKDDEKWVEADHANTVNEFDAGKDKRATELVVGSEPVVFKPCHYTRGKDGGPSDVAPPVTAEQDRSDTHPAVLAPGGKPMVLDEYNQTADEKCYPLRTASGDGIPKMVDDETVRRLTPTECERLQGFPDGYTLIEWSGAGRDEADFAETVAYLMDAFEWPRQLAERLADTPDGPRYKALGNSMATVCMRWIGQRIQLVENFLEAAGRTLK